MPTNAPEPTSRAVPRDYFATTHWSVVLRAGHDDTQAGAALEKLCQVYWYPLYAFIRRKGHNSADAEDLTQAFFERFLEKRYLDDVDPTKGKFRSFLLASLNHFLANEWKKSQRQKRGGRMAHLSLDVDTAETKFRKIDPASPETAERIFEREWALALLEQVLVRLHAEFAAEQNLELFETLKVYLTADKSTIAYADIGAKLAMNEGTVRVAVHRLRKRYRELLRDEIRHTVARPEEVDDEIRALFAAFGQ